MSEELFPDKLFYLNFYLYRLDFYSRCVKLHCHAFEFHVRFDPDKQFFKLEKTELEQRNFSLVKIRKKVELNDSKCTKLLFNFISSVW